LKLNERKTKMKVLSLSFLILATSFIQVRGLFQKKQKKEAYVYLGLMTLSAYLSIGYIIGIYIPNPATGLELIFGPIQQWIDKLLS